MYVPSVAIDTWGPAVRSPRGNVASAFDTVGYGNSTRPLRRIARKEVPT